MSSRAYLRLTAALLATTALLVGGCSTDRQPEASDPNGGGSSPSQTDSQTGSQTPTSAPPASQSATASGAVAVPVYFVGQTPLGPRLFREFRNVDAADPVDEALALLASGDALDPDYRSLLPDGVATLVDDGAVGQDGAVGVNVPVAWADRPDGMTEEEAKLAVQQVVYTVQGVLQTRSPVEFYSDGLTPMLGIDRSWFKASQDALALVNVTQPTDGATVSGTLQASGVANSFESTVPWEIRDQSGKKVLNGFSTAEGWGDRLYPWQSQVDLSGLAPGTYSFVAMTDDASDGEGAGPTEDSKTITVH
jgi:hypothetical protein